MAVLTLKTTEAIAAGDYPVEVQNIEETTGTFGPQFLFTFTLLGPEAVKGQTLRAWCSQKYSASATKPSKLYLWSVALLGGAAKQLDPQADLVGRRAIATIVVETKSDGGEFNKIHSLRALKPAAAPQPAAAVRPTPAPAPQPSLTDDEYWSRVIADGEPIEDSEVA